MKTFTPVPRLLTLAVAVAITACSAGNREEAQSSDNSAVQIENLPDPGTVLMEEVLLTDSTAAKEQQANEADFATASMPASRQLAGVGVSRPYIADEIRLQRPNTENYASLEDNGIQRVVQNPVSTFSIDVDTGAYSNVRRFLNDGHLPPGDAVRTEELVNYFSYDYPLPEGEEPFSFMTEISASPWQQGKHLIHIGIQAEEPNADLALAKNLVFLLDVSGSMNSPDKLGLLKTSLKLLTRQLQEEDRVAIVVYAGASGVVLKPTPGNETSVISAALDQLQAGGSTNGAAGIQLAYQLAEQSFVEGGINRVLLATDGDFNVGISDVNALKKLIEEKRRSGISLTTLGFGTGNYDDELMEQLADVGNGNYAYIDNLNEARKVLVDEMASTLQTVAKDVKIQIEFNPAVVSEYRLIGYENRVLATEDFNNDKVDAGEIGAGHSVTALYEISLVGSVGQSVDPLRYGPAALQAPEPVNLSAELAYLKLRYKDPDGEVSRLVERAVLVDEITENLAATGPNFRFAAAVAGFSQLLRNNNMLGNFGYQQVLELAMGAKGDDNFGYRGEFINLVKTAQALSNN